MVKREVIAAAAADDDAEQRSGDWPWSWRYYLVD